MKFHVKPFALIAAALIALAPDLALAADVINGNAPSTGKPTTGDLGATWNGTSYYLWPSDASGTPYVTEYNPTAQTPILHWTNQTLSTLGAKTDSSLVPFNTAGYRTIYCFVRFRQATVGASYELAVRGHFSAFLDSTQGWWYNLGKGGDHHGKTVTMTTLLDRFQMFALTDSLLGVPIVAPYMSVYWHNVGGTGTVYDMWFLGVR